MRAGACWIAAHQGCPAETFIGVMSIMLILLWTRLVALTFFLDEVSGFWSGLYVAIWRIVPLVRRNLCTIAGPRHTSI